ncbi:hypothetical protein VB618_12120 [Microvirga sp. CF3062]|uniref:hypothetical protein n=1 Tax=Microvirga sp. CF3062 TaxID=3110182 RepID=UPI002E783C99|nr:hypothetical protein [Microvirga sp. CF3062]MEE1656946.1 hypothetical protein [Microvirga sp. CF3062]
MFDSRASKTTNCDEIVEIKTKDASIWLENKVFTKIGVGSKAKDKNDYVVNDNKKGVLYYGADGSGTRKVVEFSTLSNNLAMTHKDFFVA